MKSKDKAMTALKPTAGQWKRDPDDNTIVITGSLAAGVGNIVCLSPEYLGFEESAKRWEENAAIIIEAGNVYHETGMTPRQLADKLAELLAAAKRFIAAGDEGLDLTRDDVSVMVEFGEADEYLRAIISKCEGTP